MQTITWNKTIVLYNLSTSGGYDYVEFDPIDKEYTTGMNRSHEGHGITLMKVKVANKKELNEKIKELKNQKFVEIKTFSIPYRERE